jgi:hypothetical protein
MDRVSKTLTAIRKMRAILVSLPNLFGQGPPHPSFMREFWLFHQTREHKKSKKYSEI